MGAGGALMLMRDDLFTNRRLRRKIPVKMKKWPQLEAVTVTAKQLTFLDSALNLEEKMPSNLWGVSSLSKNPVFLKSDLSIIKIFTMQYHLLSLSIYNQNYQKKLKFKIGLQKGPGRF